MQYIERRYVRRGAVESRRYQVDLAAQAVAENCIVVLPTGLGKTAVALLVAAEYLSRGTGVLFLAPTRVLAGQHQEFMEGGLTIDDITLVTGEDPPKKRKQAWASSLVCATPEIARNDLERGLVPADQFGAVIFDEVHRTVGDYAYSVIADRFWDAGARMVGMTATLPSEKAKASEIISRLRASRVAEMREDDPEVKEFTHQTSVEYVSVSLPPELISVQAHLRAALDRRYSELRANPRLKIGQQSVSALLRIRPFVITKARGSARALFEAIRLHHALAMLEAHGTTPFLRFCERTREKRGAAPLFRDVDVDTAIRLAREASGSGIEHPKLKKLVEIMGSTTERTLIFASYRDTVGVIRSALEEAGMPSVALVGKAGETGLGQRGQARAVQGFRDGQYRAMIATRVGEEGLDISEVGQVIFYDNVPSSIRFVQRRGRTGRRSDGRLVVLVAKGTIDETYRWIGERKVKAARTMGEKMSGMIEKGGLDGYM
ncbi:MAG: DEAD/DEAH box helicase family protein [Nitrosopumilus sp.]|nr:DEAD/DEAH box helicase family protein [Nitrosopumilus sp.]MDA7943239.1 DEAD/DEAH box helicase family protein [Nitrosopumilus sp.]MDA7952365.1 DEAD/DEAH box helicase family protein [Nitrosopumilus sp.]MDA7957503.1 DEAD/DEAH box helicase family protein [Nitrosopumilus sp.]MDA7998672.1 DEAD/DEAH box helicase family protein [Nitrosopumilus sp.]